MVPVSVNLLGSVSVRRGGSPVGFATRHEKALFVRLVLARGDRLERSTLARDSWPESIPAKAATSLRQRLAHLKESFPDRIEADRWSIRLDPAGLACDLFDRHARGLAYREEAIAGELEGEWIVARRTEWHRFRPFVPDAAGLSPDLARPEGGGPGVGERGPLDRSAVREWMEAALDGQAGPVPSPERRREFALRAVAAAGDPEEAAIWRCAELDAGLCSAPMERAVEAARAEGPTWEAGGFPGPAGLLYEIGACAAHFARDYGTALELLRSAHRAYRAAERPRAALRVRIRFHRTRIDAGELREGADRLAAIAFRCRERMPSRMATLLDLNLVFAHGAMGDSAAGRAALARSGGEARFPMLRSQNACVLALSEGRLRLAAESLGESLSGGLSGDTLLTWSRAAEVLGAADRGGAAAFAWSAALRLAREAELPISTINRDRAAGAVRSALAGSAEGFRREARSCSWDEAGDRVAESLRAVARGVSVTGVSAGF